MATNVTLKRVNNADGTTDDLHPSTSWGQIDANTIPDDFNPSSHTHGNITNGGEITTNAAIASGDRLVISDTSDSSKLKNSSITFGTGTTTFLRNDGTWSTPSYATGDITGVTAGNGLTDGGTSGDVTLNVGAGAGITVAADSVAVTNPLYYVVGNTSGTSGYWTGTISGLSAYYDGLTIRYKQGINGASNTYLNINSLGDKQIYRYGGARLTTHWPVGTISTLTYNSSDNRFYATPDYNSTDDYRIRWQNDVAIGAYVHGYQLLAEGTDGAFYPVTEGGSTANTNTVSTADLRIGGTLLAYDSSTDIAAGGTSSGYEVYEGINSSGMEYWNNRDSGWATDMAAIYLVGIDNGDGSYNLDNTSYTSFLTQTIPTSDDGKIYIHIGWMNNTYDNWRLEVVNQPYVYKNGAFQLYSGYATYAENANKLDNLNSTQFLRSDQGDTMSGNLTLTNTAPRLILTDTDNDSDFHIQNAHGVFTVGDTTNQEDRFEIDSSGNVDILSGDLSVNGNIKLTGDATTTNQGLMVDFTGFDKEGTTDFTDRAYIQHTTNTGGHTGSVLKISSRNDSNDGIAFDTHASSQLKHNGNTIWTAGNDGAGSGLAADTLDGQHGSYYAPLASPALTGTPTAPTAAANTNTTQIATTAYVQQEITDLIGSAPEALNTLNELAAAINDDASYASTITTALAGKVAKSGDSMTGSLTINSSGTIGGSTLGNGWLKVGSTLAMDNNEIYFGTTGYVGTIGAYDLLLMYNSTERLRVTNSGIDVSGNIIGDNLYLGADNQTPKIDMLFDDHASGVVWDTRIEIGKSDDFDSSPSAVPSTNAYGMNIKGNSDGVFFGMEQYNTTNFRPIINWGDDTTDSPFSIRFNNSDRLTLDTTGNLSVSNDLYGKSSNGQWSSLYRWGGIYFTWDSDSYGTNTHHSIRSTYGDNYGDDLTINSFHHLRVNLDSNSNNTDARFEIGHNTTGTGNLLFVVHENGDVGIGTGNTPGYKLNVNGDSYFADTVTIDTGTSSDALVIKGTTPTISLLDDDSSADDFYLHTNSNNFYILTDRDGNNNVGTGFETPHPLQLEADTNIGYVFGQRIFNEAYHPNADKWTTARTLSLTGDVTGSVSWDGSANASITTTAAADVHKRVGTISTQNWNDYIDGTETGYNSVTNMSGSNKPSAYTYGIEAHWSVASQGKFQIYAPHNGSEGNGLHYRTGWNTDYDAWNRLYDNNYHPEADTWTTARTITLGGDLTGSVSLDGSANVTLTAAVADNSHSHTISNVSNLQAALDDKAEVTYTSGGTTSDVSTLNFSLSGSTLTITTS